MSENDDAIERLEKKLDSHKTDLDLIRSRLYTRGTDAPVSWMAEPPPKTMRPIFRMKPLELLFGASVVFFVLALSVAGLLFFSGNNTVSTKNVDVHISGPAEIGAGSTLSLQVVVSNHNAVPMELTDLLIEFPSGTRSDTDISIDLPRIRQSLGTIEPGESVNRTIRAVIFGVQGSDFSVKALAEYRVPSSNAIFVSETTYTARLNESSAAISVDALKETVSGQKVSLAVTVSSNAPVVLSDMLLLATYPPGFLFDSSSPLPSEGRSVWALGDIEPGGTRKVIMSGTFTGEDGEARVVHFSTGNRKTGQDDSIAAPLATSDLSLTIKKPFISVTLSLGGDSADRHAISRGERIRGVITWANNLPVRIQNAAITLSLNGQVLDRTKVTAEKGFYSSNTSSIVWDKSTDNDLIDVAPGASGAEQFSFAALPPEKGVFKNPEINLSVTVSGSRLSETNVPESVQSSATTRVLVLTDFVVHATVTRGVQDTGPVPPKVDRETTYTVTWDVSNSSNAIANAAVTATLPSYVTFKNVVSPSNASFSYNDTDRTMRWDVGDLAIGQSKTVSFRVGFTPSVTQVAGRPVIVTEQRLSGFDRFVRQDMEQSIFPLSTLDAEVSSGDGTVVP